jgi:hypothetical protein
LITKEVKMKTCNLNNADDLAEIATQYSTELVRLIREEQERGEMRPQSARRELIATRFGLSVGELLTAVHLGVEINWKRQTADWTQEEWDEYEIRQQAIMSLVLEATEGDANRKSEIDELNRLFEL